MGIRRFIRYLAVASLGLFYGLWFVGANVDVRYIEAGKVIPRSQVTDAVIERWIMGKGITQATFIAPPWGGDKIRLEGDWSLGIIAGLPLVLVALTWVFFGGKPESPSAKPDSST